MENQYSLYHYGVKGMRWGHRKARKALSKTLGKKKEDITDEEIEEYRKDMKYVKKNRGSINIQMYENGSFDYLDRNGKKISPMYAQLIMKKANMKRTVKAAVASTAFMLGVAFIAEVLQN